MQRAIAIAAFKIEMVETVTLLNGIESLQIKLDAVASTTSQELLSLKEEIMLLRGAIERLSGTQESAEKTVTCFDEAQKSPCNENPKSSSLAESFSGLKLKRSSTQLTQRAAKIFRHCLADHAQPWLVLQTLLFVVAFIPLVLTLLSSRQQNANIVYDARENLVSISREAQNQQQESMDQLRMALTESFEAQSWSQRESMDQLRMVLMDSINGRAEEQKLQNLRYARANIDDVETFYIFRFNDTQMHSTKILGTKYILQIIESFGKGRGVWIPKSFSCMEGGEEHNFQYLQEKLVNQLHFLLGVKPAIRELDNHIVLRYPKD